MSLTGISANRLELLQIAEAVAREKSIDKEIVIEAIEEAIQKGARVRYGAEHDIRVHIDQKTGEVTVKRVVTVIADDATFGTVIAEDGTEAPADEPMGVQRLSDALQRQDGLRRQGLRGGPAALRVRPGADPDGPPGGHRQGPRGR